MDAILKIEGIKKNFGKKKILKGISFEVKSGDIMAFIGPNGSGKTTTIKLILGLQSITEGTILINGYNIKTNFVDAIKKVGAIVENPDSYMYLTGKQNLILIANLYDNIDEKKLEEIISLVGLENRINDKVSKYSLGMRQRLGIAKALIMNPNLLILDEPTNGLDPEGIHELRILLKKLAKNGMGILISSHNLSELESFCNKICIIASGEIIERSNVEDLKKIESSYRFTVSSTVDLNIKKAINVTKDSFDVITDKENINDIIKVLIKNKIKVYEVSLIKLTLEEAFLRKTGGNKID